MSSVNMEAFIWLSGRLHGLHGERNVYEEVDLVT